MRKASILLVTIIALIFCISSFIPLSFASGPTIVQNQQNGLGSSTNDQITQAITVTGGDTVIAGATQAVRSGTPALITVSSPGVTCQVAVNGVSASTSNAVTISICPNIVSGTYTFTAQTSGNSCPSGTTACGFMSIWLYELSGSAFIYTNTTATNAGTALTAASNSINSGVLSLGLGFLSQQSVSTVATAGSGFTFTAACFVSGVNSGVYGCSEQKSFASVTATTFPVTLSANASDVQWENEGIIITGGSLTSIITLTVTAWNTIGTQTSTSWIILALTLFFFPALTWGILKGFNAGSSTVVFATLLSLTAGALIGVIGDFESNQANGANVVPYGVVIFQIIALAVFIFRARSRSSF